MKWNGLVMSRRGITVAYHVSLGALYLSAADVVCARNDHQTLYQVIRAISQERRDNVLSSPD